MTLFASWKSWFGGGLQIQNKTWFVIKKPRRYFWAAHCAGGGFCRSQIQCCTSCVNGGSLCGARIANAHFNQHFWQPVLGQWGVAQPPFRRCTGLQLAAVV